MKHADGRGDDEEGEDEEHAGEGDRARHHEAEGGVEDELREPRIANPDEGVRDAHEQVQGDRPAQLLPSDGEDVAGEDLADVLGALRRAVHEQQRGGGGHDVDDADLRFLRHAPRPGARRGEEGGGGERESKGVGVGGETLRWMAEDEGGGGADRRRPAPIGSTKISAWIRDRGEMVDP